MPLPAERPDALDSPVVPRIIKYASRAQAWVYRRTKGRIGANWRIGAGFRKPVPTLLLLHRGRKTGKQYTTPLLYLEDGRDLVVVASQGGLPDHPQWYRNLLAGPEVRVQVKDVVRDVRARPANPPEREELWPRLVGLYPDFGTYQSWTEREIPVVVLEPR